MHIFVQIILTLFIIATGLQAIEPIFPDSQARKFLALMETRGLLTLPAGSLTQAELAERLVQLLQKVAQDPGLVSEHERDLLKQLYNAYADEIDRMNRQADGTRQPRHLFRLKTGAINITGHGLFTTTLISKHGRYRFDEKLFSETGTGIDLAGRIHPAMTFRIVGQKSWRRGTGINDLKFDAGKKSLAYISGNAFYPDWLEAIVTWRLPWLNLEVGQQKLDWGPGYHGGLLLSANMPPAFGVKLLAVLGRFRFTSAHLSLAGMANQRYLAAHRLEWQVKPGIVIAGNETVLYSNRNPELIYLNPLIPYHVAEHHQGDRDNNMLSIDFKIRLRDGLKIYGEYFIDDMTMTRSWLRYYGNKFAFLLGLHAAAPVTLKNTELHLEYTRVEPFVYTHYVAGNIYTHRNQIIGYWLGPDTDDFLLEFGYRPQRDLYLTSRFESIRRGDWDVNRHHILAIDGPRKHFLAGTVENVKIAGLGIEDQIRPGIFIVLQYHVLWTKNPGREKGGDSRDQQGVAQLQVNY